MRNRVTETDCVLPLSILIYLSLLHSLRLTTPSSSSINSESTAGTLNCQPISDLHLPSFTSCHPFSYSLSFYIVIVSPTTELPSHLCVFTVARHHSHVHQQLLPPPFALSTLHLLRSIVLSSHLLISHISGPLHPHSSKTHRSSSFSASVSISQSLLSPPLTITCSAILCRPPSFFPIEPVSSSSSLDQFLPFSYCSSFSLRSLFSLSDIF